MLFPWGGHWGYLRVYAIVGAHIRLVLLIMCKNVNFYLFEFTLYLYIDPDN